MSLYTLKQLFHDCSTRMTRTKCTAETKRETLEDVWRAFNDWISSRFDVGKGVHIATFASVSWETCTNSRNQPKLRPVLVLSETFTKTYGLTQKRGLSGGRTLASLEEINFTKIAIKFSRSLTKDVVFSGIRDLLQRIGEVAGTGAPLSIAFNIGRLIAKNRCVSMVFDPLQIPRALEDEIARSLLGSPQLSQLGDVSDFAIPPDCVVDFANAHPEDHRRSVSERAQVETLSFTAEFVEALPTSRSNPENVIPSVGDASVGFEDELALHDLLPRSPVANQSGHASALESAFRRHVTHLAEEVDLEAKYAHDVTQQQRRDVEAIASEAKTRRLNAQDMQRHLRVQMEHQRSARQSEKNEQKRTEPSVNSFYCDSELTRLGYDDANYIQRNKQTLKEQLLHQISSKEHERAHERQQSLHDDQLFLRRLRNEMDTIEQKQTHDRDELRKTLTDSWRRDATIKKLVETKKKQRAAEQVQRVATTPRRSSYAQLTPRNSVHAAALGGGGGDDTDFSVGFDIRSVCE